VILTSVTSRPLFLIESQQAELMAYIFGEDEATFSDEVKRFPSLPVADHLGSHSLKG